MIKSATTSDVVTCTTRQHSSALATECYMVLTPDPAWADAGDIVELANQMYHGLAMQFYATGHRIFCERMIIRNLHIKIDPDLVDVSDTRLCV